MAGRAARARTNRGIWLPRLRKRRLVGKRRAISIEPLEPRLLLSGDPLAPLAFQMDGDTDDLTLRLEEVLPAGGLEAVETLQLVDNDTGAVVAEQALEATSEVVITGTDLDDRFEVDASLSETELPLPVSFTGGGGDDTVAVRATTGAGAYTVDGPGSLLVARYAGCYQDVLGFPMVKLDSLLRELGVHLFDRMDSASAVFL